IEDIPEITAVTLFEYYKRVLEEDDIDVYITGDINIAEMEEQTEKIFKLKANPDHQLPEKEIVEASASVVMKEEQDIQQAKLHMNILIISRCKSLMACLVVFPVQNYLRKYVKRKVWLITLLPRLKGIKG